MKEFRLLSTSGILGFGFPEASLAAGWIGDTDVCGGQQHAPHLDLEIPL